MSEHNNVAEHQPGTQKAYHVEGMDYVHVPVGEPPLGGMARDTLHARHRTGVSESFD